MTQLSYLEASRQALFEIMSNDNSVWVLGEDLGRGGVFAQYEGLQKKFGQTRIVDTPISESCILGAAVGAAMAGTRPVVEMRFSDFALCAIDELVNQAAKARYMFGGQTRVPLVIREPIGIWRSSAAQHSQSLESWYTHIPGLVVVAPSSPQDNKGLLIESIKCDDPVVYMEHKNLWNIRGPINDAEIIELGKARICRNGKHITLVSWSEMVYRCLEAAEILSTYEIEVEVIDLRTLWPWDRQCVFDSVKKTKKLLIAHEAVRVSGFGAEIAASVTEELFDTLTSPPLRLAAPRIPVSYAPNLENEVRVTAKNIVNTIRKQLER